MIAILSSLVDKLRGHRRPTRSRCFVAVDFDSRHLRIVQAEQVGSTPRILNLVEAPFPDGMNLEDADAVGRFLGGALRELRLSGSAALMSVPRRQAVLKSVALPPGTSDADMPAMVQYKVQGELPFRAEEAAIDYTTEEHYNADAAREADPAKQGGPGGVNLLVAAVQLPVVDYYRRVAAAAEVKLERLGLRPYANVRCVDVCTVRGSAECVAVVHVTADETEIDVVAGSSLSFSRSAGVKIPLAGQSGAAELEESVGAVVTEVVRSVQSYQSVQRGGRIGAVLVAGGTGIEPRVTEVLGERLGVKSEMFDPSGALRLHGGPPGAAFISALGLAFGHHGADELRLDFLSPKRPQAPRDMKKIRLYAVAAGLAVVMALGASVRGMYLGGKKDRLTQLRSQLSKLSAEDRQVRDLARRAGEVEVWTQDRREWLDHLAYLSVLLPSARDGYVAALTTTADGSINVPLRASSGGTLDETYKRINDANCYQLKLGPFDSIEDKYGFRFTTVMKLIVKPRAQVDFATTQPVQRPGDDVSAEVLVKKAVEVAGGSGAAAPGTGAASPGAGTGTPAAGTPLVTGGATAGPAVFVDPSTMSEEQRNQWESVGRFDADGDGKLSPQEEKVKYEWRRRVYHLYDEHRKEMIPRFDKNGDGKLDKDEYRTMDYTMWAEEKAKAGGS